MLIFLGDWREGIRYFHDFSPIDNIYILNRIKVETLSAKWCNNNITLKIYLQGELLGRLFIDTEECQCFSCPHPYTFIKPLNNFTEYNYGGINNIKIDSGFLLTYIDTKRLKGNDQVCIGKVKISFTFKSKVFL